MLLKGASKVFALQDVPRPGCAESDALFVSEVRLGIKSTQALAGLEQCRLGAVGHGNHAG